MIPDDLRDEIRQFDAELPVERAASPPASWYTDPRFLQLEKTTTFGRHWQFAGRTDQLRRIGDYFAGSFLGNPYLVTRDEEGQVRAYHNVCRHRGTRLVSDAGNLRHKRLVCPYHGWTYGLDGRLLAAPRMDGAEGFDTTQVSLVPLPVEVWGPLVFLHFAHDVSPAPLAPQLTPVKSVLDQTSFESLTFVTRKRYTVACNWKVFVDNYLDGGYHVPHMHKGLAGQLDLASYRHEIFDTFSIQYCAASGRSDGRGADFAERLAGGAVYAWFHPNLMINRYGPMMDVNHVVPLDQERCEVVFDYFFDRTSQQQPGFVTESLSASERVQEEDMAVCRMVQEGLGSTTYRPGRYAPRLEVLAHHFHRLLVRDFASV